MKQLKKKVIIIDGNNCLYRYYFIFKNLKNSKKNPTGVIYGILKLIQTLKKKYKPKKIIFVFDHPSKNFRKKIYKNYKSNRKKMPKSLKVQIKPILKIIYYLGIPMFQIPNTEADDIIGTISHKEKKKNKILIFTSDKDMYQLIDKNVKIINFRNKILNKNKIKKKIGIKPKLFVEYLSLVGDPSDNIPGIPGIGKISALKILKKYNSLKKIYLNLSKLKKINSKNSKKYKELFKKYKKKIFLYYKIIKIKKNIFLKKYKKIIKNKQINYKKLLFLFKKYNLKTLSQYFLKKNINEKKK